MRRLQLTQTIELLDPARVRAPSWLRFRVPQSFTDGSFSNLKSSIVHMGGNVEPVKVCPVGVPVADGQGAYELVYGFRRHAACLEVGLPLRAVVDSALGAREAMIELAGTNAGAPLIERGRLYHSALQAGLFPSTRRLAESCGLTVIDAANALRAAELPEALLNLLRDPRTLSAALVRRLARRMHEDPAGMLARIAELSRTANTAKRRDADTTRQLLA